jgi:hypothetical protein
MLPPPPLPYYLSAVRVLCLKRLSHLQPTIPFVKLIKVSSLHSHSWYFAYQKIIEKRRTVTSF